jgi:hypothetical protein
MKKFAITHSTAATLLENAELRSASDFVRVAYEKINTDAKTAGCSSCAKRKRINDAISELVANLQNASDLELDRIKKVLGADKLVFGSGMSFIER